MPVLFSRVVRDSINDKSTFRYRISWFAVTHGTPLHTGLLLEPTILQLPIYQRRFSWGKKELEDLWNDLIYFDRENKNSYYFGAIFHQKTSPQISVGLRTYDVLQIIDGQQRIAASLILLRTIIDMIKSLKDPSVNIKEIESLEENYLKRGSITRLTLSGEDQAIFQSILSDKKLPEPKTQSQKRLKRYKRFLHGKIPDKKRHRQRRIQRISPRYQRENSEF